MKDEDLQKHIALHAEQILDDRAALEKSMDDFRAVMEGPFPPIEDPLVEAARAEGVKALPDVPVDVSAALDQLDEEQLTDDEARALAGELASKVKVDAQVSPLTPEQEADQELSLQVYECPQGHKQHGPCEVSATSKHTGEVIAKSGANCVACQVLDLGRRYPTFPVTESATRAERRKLAAVKRKRRRRAN